MAEEYSTNFTIKCVNSTCIYQIKEIHFPFCHLLPFSESIKVCKGSTQLVFCFSLTKLISFNNAQQQQPIFPPGNKLFLQIILIYTLPTETVNLRYVTTTANVPSHFSFSKRKRIYLLLFEFTRKLTCEHILQSFYLRALFKYKCFFFRLESV